MQEPCIPSFYDPETFTARDKTQPRPTLLLPAVQVNVRAGRLPPPEDNDVSSN